MVNHPVLLLARKVELHYSTQIEKFWKANARKKAAKFYGLIITAKNDEQLKRELLFKKLTGKTYSAKTDDLWRNEIRVLKAELEKFIIETEHQIRLKGDENYSDWLLIQGFERLKFKEGIAEKSEHLLEAKEFSGDFQFILDAEFLQLQSRLSTEPDIKKLMGSFGGLVKNWETTLAEFVWQNMAKANVLIAQYNVVTAEYQNADLVKPFKQAYSRQLPDTNITRHYYHYAESFTGSFEEKMEHFDKALQLIAPIARRSAVFEQRRVVLQIAIARQLSTSGYFDKAHEVFTDIKDSVERKFIEYKTVFYVNYVTNLVKCQRYTQALQILDEELIAANALYKNMLLQNRLLCYLNLRDVKSLSAYISFNLDEAPFPQNYMLKLIKSAYFYLVGEYDLAAQLVANLQQTKDANNRLHTFKPIAGLYKKFYSAAIKNKGLKRWDNKDVAALVKEVERIETTSLPEMKLVSVYSWVKGEIVQMLAKTAL